MTPDSLWVLCLLLFLDGATFSFATTPLLLQYGKLHEPWEVALLGGAASAAGSMVQFWLLRWILASNHPYMRRFAPSREKLEAALQQFPSASFVALLVARATPLPDAPLKLVAAALEYPVPLYGLAIFLGALPYYFTLAFVGRLVKLPGWVILAGVGVILLAVGIDALRRRRRRPAA